MIHHIRRARHMVYIESQYFLSSAHLWSTDSKAKCGNLIAAELMLKICQKIEAGERFAAYIVVPMWPEGIPESGAVQAILRFQALTMEAMYKRIALALKRRKEAAKKNGETIPDAHPRDYLNFYTLANRETLEGDESSKDPRPKTDEITLAKTRRHLIYVHSKMVIVDDEIALIGSSNINQRSLDGARDSELLLGSWQPAHMATKESIAHGEVHGFRLHCWESNIGHVEKIFSDPSSLECVHRVNEIADKNWEVFSSKTVADMDSHILPYPVVVEHDGSVKAGGKYGDDFLDTKAKTTGAKTKLPEILTT
jgi:phospholipase D1/2